MINPIGNSVEPAATNPRAPFVGVKLEFPALTLKELTVLLIKHYQVHEGLWDVAVELQVGLGAFGPAPEKVYPGAMIGVSGFGLKKAEKLGSATVNAAEVNPKP